MSKFLSLVSLCLYSGIAYTYFSSLERVSLEQHRAALEKEGFDFYKSFGGRWKFLTIINVVLQAVFFTLCALNALLGLFNYKKTILSKIVNFFYTTLAFPVAMIVVTVFWGLYFIDRSLIFPQYMELVLPFWKNHIMHTLPVLTALLENFLTKHRYHENFIRGFTPLFLFALAYIIWVYVVAVYGGFWVYPFMKKLSAFSRGLFFAKSVLYAAFLYKLGDVINSLLWRRKEATSTSVEKSPKKTSKKNK